MYTQLQEIDVWDIAGRYDLTIVDYETMAGGATNSHYLLRAHQGSYVLTVFDSTTFDRTVELGRLLLLLKECAFPTTQPVFAANSEIVTLHESKPVMMKVYIAGQVYQDLDKTMLYQVGMAMARLHQVPCPDFLSNRQPYGLRKFSSFQGQNIDTEYEAWIAKRLSYFERQKPQGLPRGLIHSDIFYDNVLFDGARLKAIIDFEDALCGDKALELGMSIVGLCTRGPAVALEKARALVKGYEQIRVLEEGEKNALQLFVEYAAATVSCWRYWKYHFDTPSVEKADSHRQMARVAEEVRNIPKARFLEAIFS